MSTQLEPHRVIGVGMGGSCPECRGPLDLGQEYCLECGANVHAKKRVTRVTAVPGGASATVVGAPKRGGFPWIWFTVLLLLAVGALASVLAYESSGTSSKTQSKSGSDTTAGVSSTPSTASAANQVPTTPTFPTTPASTTPGTNDSTTPATGVNGSTTPAGGGVPGSTGIPGSVTPGTDANTSTPSNGTVPTTPAVTTPVTTTPAITTPATGGTSPATSTTPTSTTPASSTDLTSWPAGQSGWTVVLGSYGKTLYTESDAQQRASQARSHGLNAGTLDSDQFHSLNPGYWVVFSGDYATQALAQSHVAAAVEDGYASAYARQVKP